MSIKDTSLKDYFTLPVLETYGEEKIKQNIPHREPFLMVDEILVLEPRKKYIGVHHVRPDEYYFEGHFPGSPVMPGVLVLECMSQAFGGAVMSVVAKDQQLPLFLSVEEAKFRGIVLPGDTLEMPIHILRLGRLSKIYCEAYVKQKLCTQATLTFILGEKPHD